MHKKKAGKLQTGSTIPKQYWLAVNGKPTNNENCSMKFCPKCPEIKHVTINIQCFNITLIFI